ncbi:hypothetical protein Pmani_013725 [Petrolisthes manimaculis]|uniref:Transmembrane protein 59 n=1 Tax=Petrolisthes manimaculis TaxID=1843537 RepID=A0AAE1UBW3_9EUCA|nr:hypothetical protein Pmani_013725 [Petrolisthes manimaculis]
MALLWWAVVSCAVFSSSRASETFDNILGDVKPCEEYCTKSYSPHTNPNVDDNDACNRGCRFYTISKFLNIGEPKHGNAVDGSDANPVKKACDDACVEAYNETSHNTVACKYGCESQSTTAEQQKKKGEDDGPSMHLLSPLMQVRSVYSSFIGAIHIVRSSLVTYFVSDDSQIVAVESAPQIIMEVVPGAEKIPSVEEAQEKSRNLALSEARPDQPTVTYLEPGSYIPKPHIVLLGVLALSFVTTLLIYSICITFVPRKSKVYGEGLSIQADPLPLPVKLVRPEDLTKLSLTEEEDYDGNQQAPPLPTKVNLPDTLI